MADREWIDKISEISNEELLENLTWIPYDTYYRNIYDACISEITKRLNKQKYGYWIFDGNDCFCSNCKFGMEFEDKEFFKYYYRNCPFCGAKMESDT